MKLIIVTAPTFFVEEDKIITALFEEGLDILHLRKPETPAMYSERLLTLIPEKYHRRIVTHEHFYVFMSPVYDCITKTGTLSGYTPEELRTAGKERIIDTKVMALGGITPDNILEIKDFGFGGAVVLGDLWNKFNVCTDRDYLGVIRHFKKLKEMAD